MKKKTYSLLLLALVAVLFSGCVKEKSEVCYSGITLRYHYALNPEDTNKFATEINELKIHAFDQNGVFYKEFVFDDPAQLTEEHFIHLPLPDGKWDIVTWGSEGKGSLSDSYDMGILSRSDSGPSYNTGIEEGLTNIEEARLWIKNLAKTTDDGRRHVTDQISKLYHASLYDVTTTTTTSPTRIINVPMMQNTNTLRVVITGLPQTMTRAANEDFGLTADMVNGHYRHNNLLCSDGFPLKYENGVWENEGEEGVQNDLTVLRPFIDDTTSELTITIPQLEPYGYKDGKIAVKIVPTITQSPDYRSQTDLDRANTYIFEFDFDINMNLTVTVNGWKVRNIIPEI